MRNTPVRNKDFRDIKLMIQCRHCQRLCYDCEPVLIKAVHGRYGQTIGDHRLNLCTDCRKSFSRWIERAVRGE